MVNVVCEVTFPMATVTNILLLILTVRGAIVLSQHEPAQVIDNTSPAYAEALRQMELVIDNQRQLMQILAEQDADIKQLQEDADGLRAHFACRFPPCRWCTRPHVSGKKIPKRFFCNIFYKTWAILMKLGT